MIGISPTIGFNIQTAPNPAKYNLTGWWKGSDFTANQILGTSSIGTSGSRKLYDNSFGNGFLPLKNQQLNGIDVLDFSASFVFLQTDTDSNSFFTSTDMCIIVCCKPLVQDTNDPVTSNNRMMFGMAGDNGGLYGTSFPKIIASNVTTGPVEQNDSGTITANNWAVFTLLHTGGKIYYRRNLEAFGAGVTSGNTFSLFNGLQTSNSIGNLKMILAEIMTSATFNQTECDDMAKYLSVKYNLGF